MLNVGMVITQNAKVAITKWCGIGRQITRKNLRRYVENEKKLIQKKTERIARNGLQRITIEKSKMGEDGGKGIQNTVAIGGRIIGKKSETMLKSVVLDWPK